MKKTVTVIALLLAALMLCGCSSEPKQYSYKGINITLPGNFKEDTAEGYDYCLSQNDCIVLFLIESAEALGVDESLNAHGYAEMVLVSNDLDTTLTDAGDHTYFEFTRTVEGDNISYLACCYRNGASFWLLQFACPESKYSDMRSDMLSWADSVTFNG